MRYGTGTAFVIIPSYNEGENIRRIFEALEEEFRDFHYDFEIIFVNDGSKDNTLQYMRELSHKSAKVKYISFSRNFGKEAAILAGLEHAEGKLRSLWTPTCSTQRI